MLYRFDMSELGMNAFNGREILGGLVVIMASSLFFNFDLVNHVLRGRQHYVNVDSGYVLSIICELITNKLPSFLLHSPLLDDI